MKRMTTGLVIASCVAWRVTTIAGSVPECVWTGTDGTVWHDPGNWQDGLIPNASDAVASFVITNDVHVTVDTDVILGRLAIAGGDTGGTLTLVSEGKTIAFSSSGSPEISVGRDVELHVKSVTLTGEQKVLKSGAGVLSVNERVAENLKLDYTAGGLGLISNNRSPVTVAESDGLWTYICRTNGVDALSDQTPYNGLGGVYFGSTDGYCQTKTVRTSPISVSGKVRISGTVTMNGTGSWGMALVLHNDPRGADAIADYTGTYSLSYSDENKIDNSLALGFVNYHRSGYLNTCKWGVDGEWHEPFSCSPISINTDGGIERVFGIVLEFDANVNTASITMTQEGAEPFTSTLDNVDLTEICGSDMAYLAFVTDAGGRTTYGMISDLEVSYPDDGNDDDVYFSALDINAANASITVDGYTANVPVASSVTIGNDVKLDLSNGYRYDFGSCVLAGSAGVSSGIVTVSPDDGAWSHCRVKISDKEGEADTSHTAYSDLNGIYFGSTSGNCFTKTVRSTPIDVSGKVTITGDVAYRGTGSMIWAVILHNDPRGADAMAVASEVSTSAAYSGENCITNSFAVGFLNYNSYIGKYKWGLDGTWGDDKNTDPVIYFNTRDESGSPDNILREMKLKLEFNPAERSVKLTLVQNQNGEDVTFTETRADVDLTEICRSKRAYLAVTTSSGGRTMYGVIDNLKIVTEPCGNERTMLTGRSLVAAADGLLAFAGIDFAPEVDDFLPSNLTVELKEGSKFRTTAETVQKICGGHLTLNGKPVPAGLYTAENCDWITGDGRVSVGLDRTMILIR